MRTHLVGSLGAAILLRLADGFMTPLLPAHGRAHLQRAARTTSHTTMQAGGTYADKLRQAQAAKETASREQHSSSPTSPLAAAVPLSGPAAGSGGGDGGMPLPSDSTSPFPPDILEEMRTAIKILAARLQREKPMTRAEFERFEAAVAIIVEDALPAQELPTQQVPMQQASSPPRAAVSAPPVVSTPAPSVAADAEAKPMDEYESEGPAWDPAQGGYGLPTGVENSYVLEGMAQMSPEEYQEALRKKVVSRAQTARKSGVYGNIVSNDYLKFLNKNPMEGDAACEQNKKDTKGHEDFKGYK